MAIDAKLLQDLLNGLPTADPSNQLPNKKMGRIKVGLPDIGQAQADLAPLTPEEQTQAENPSLPTLPVDTGIDNSDFTDAQKKMGAKVGAGILGLGQATGSFPMLSDALAAAKPFAYPVTAAYNVGKDAIDPSSDLRKAIASPNDTYGNVAQQGGQSLGRGLSLEPQLKSDAAKSAADIVGQALGGLATGVGQGATAAGNLGVGAVQPAAHGIGEFLSALGLGTGKIAASTTDATQGLVNGVGNTLGGIRQATSPIAQFLTDPNNPIGSLIRDIASQSGAPSVINQASNLLGGYSTFPNMGGQQSTPMKQQERTDYFNMPSNGFQGTSPGTGANLGSLSASNPAGQSDLNGIYSGMGGTNIDQQISMLESRGARGPGEADRLKGLYALKEAKMKMATEQMNVIKSQRERTQDLGNIPVGSKIHDNLTAESQAIKKIDATMQSLDDAANTGDYKTVNAVGQELVDFLRTTTSQQVTTDQRETLNPLVQKVKGFLGMGEGDVLQPQNLPVLVRTIKAIRNELKTDMNGYIQNPQNAISPELRERLFNNTVEPTGEKFFANKATVDANGNVTTNPASQGKSFAEGFTKENDPVLVDPTTHFPHRIMLTQGDNGKTVAKMSPNVLMSDGSEAIENNGKLYKQDGSPITNADKIRIENVNLVRAPYVAGKFDPYGQPLYDQNRTQEIERMSANEDSFNGINNKYAGSKYAGPDNETSNADKTTQQNLALMRARNLVDEKVTGAQKAQLVKQTLGGAAGEIPLIGPFFKALAASASTEPTNYPQEMNNIMSGKSAPAPANSKTSGGKPKGTNPGKRL